MSSKHRKPLTPDDCTAIARRLIDGKNDREAAILAGAFLEAMIHDLLEVTLVDSHFQRTSTLFDYPKPLSSFGNMLALAFAFGRISQDEFHFSRIVKNVRDYAAHSLTLTEEDAFSFRSEQVRKILREFNPKFALQIAPKDLREKAEENFEKLLDHDARLAFRVIFCSAMLRLLARSVVSEPLQPLAEINQDVGQSHTAEGS